MTVKVQTFAFVVDMGKLAVNALATLRMKKQQYGHTSKQDRRGEVVKKW